MIGHCVLCGKEDYLSFGVCRHCTHGAKNFMRALEGLKRVAAYGNEGKSLNPYELRGYLNQLIAELEEVK